jgi:hypothetical protein
LGGVEREPAVGVRRKFYDIRAATDSPVASEALVRTRALYREYRFYSSMEIVWA